MAVNKDSMVIGVAMVYAERVGFPGPPPPVVADGELAVDAESAALAEWLDRVLTHAEAHPSECAQRLGAAIEHILDTPEAA